VTEPVAAPDATITTTAVGVPTPAPDTAIKPSTPEPAAAPPAVAVPTADNLLVDPPKPAEGEPAKPAEGEPVKPDAPAAIKPEDYKIPEALVEQGFTVDDPTVKGYLTKAAELGLPQEQVAALMETVAPAIREQALAPYQAWKTLQDQWSAEIKADPELGGAKLGETVAKIRQGITAFATKPGATAEQVAAEVAKVDEALRITGAGNNPTFVRLLHHAFSRLTEGNHVAGSPPGGGQKRSPAEVLFNHADNRKA